MYSFLIIYYSFYIIRLVKISIHVQSQTQTNTQAVCMKLYDLLGILNI